MENGTSDAGMNVTKACVSSSVPPDPGLELKAVVAQFRASEVLQAVAQRMEEQLADLLRENSDLRSQHTTPVPPLLEDCPLLPYAGTAHSARNAAHSSIPRESACSLAIPSEKASLKTTQTMELACNPDASDREPTFAYIDNAMPANGGVSSGLRTFGFGRQSMAAAFQTINGPRKSLNGQIRTQYEAPVFADVNAMKMKVREAILKKPYDVSDFYKDEGFFQAVARSAKFEIATLSVISLNALWIAVDIDVNGSKHFNEKDTIFQVIDYMFFVYFSAEWICRFIAFRIKRDGFKDNWFCFDSVLVLTMCVDTVVPLAISKNSERGDTAVLKVIRLSRITRMARMAKLLRNCPELVILIRGILLAGRSVMFTLMLLGLLIYVFAVALRQLTEGTPIGDQYFPSVYYAMKSLLLYGTLPDNAQFVDALGSQNLLLGVTLLIFVMFASLCLLNMLVGVLCEVVSGVSSVEKEGMKVNFVKSQLLTMLCRSGLDADEDMMITRVEFEDLLLNKEAARVMAEVEVDPVNLVDFGDFIFKDAGTEGLSFKDFIEWILDLRGTNQATFKDLVNLRKVLLQRLADMDKKMQDMMALLRTSALSSDYAMAKQISLSVMRHGAAAGEPPPLPLQTFEASRSHSFLEVPFARSIVNPEAGAEETVRSGTDVRPSEAEGSTPGSITASGETLDVKAAGNKPLPGVPEDIRVASMESSTVS